MMMTLKDIQEKLVQEYDEITLLEYLQVDGALLVERFSDIIERDFDKFHCLVSEVDDEFPEEEDRSAQEG